MPERRICQIWHLLSIGALVLIGCDQESVEPQPTFKLTLPESRSQIADVVGVTASSVWMLNLGSVDTYEQGKITVQSRTISVSATKDGSKLGFLVLNVIAQNGEPVLLSSTSPYDVLVSVSDGADYVIRERSPSTDKSVSHPFRLFEITPRTTATEGRP